MAGFTYLVMLFAVAVSGAMLATGSLWWHHEAQRQRERELLRVGDEFQKAISRYYERSPGSVKHYPGKLEDLLYDLRYLSTERHLRRIYRDPMTGKAEWGIVYAPGGGIMGIYSLSDARPVKTGGFDAHLAQFENKSRYSDWKFVYEPPLPALPILKQRG